ncbi:hypothetical protein GP486_005405 [Trichoglossum hirsutum]|uniref:Transmembrane protein n=1 Tax=Trichoglossum hirsutum TaxID=265104 RepID=A0A9P8L9A6_9PEZI|nr:hypothetical protein GP486_005405 [Trichoglossum hirsutum]
MEINIRPSLRRNEKLRRLRRERKPTGPSREAVQDVEDRRDEEIVKEMWFLIVTGLALFLGGGYFYIVWGIWLRHCLNERQNEFKLLWPSLFSFPEVVRRSAPEEARLRAEGVPNGLAKKSQ